MTLMVLFVQPPITFQPPPPPGSNASSAAQQPKPAAPGPSHPDLLTRYNLKDKVDGDAEGSSSNSSGPEASGGQGSGKAWSSNRDERQSLLQKRRDQMILEARRKMAAKLAADKAAEGAAS